MKNQLRIFENENFGTIRVVEIDGEPWWVLKDVCLALGLFSPHKVAERLDEDERNLIPLTDTLGRSQRTAIINESGLYAVILRSDKPKAKDFRRWITHDVLPSIRKRGFYVLNSALEDMTKSRDAAENLLAMFVERLQIAAPKAQYYELVMQSADAVQTSILAKDYGMGAAAFNKLLHGFKIQFKVGGTWVLYKKYADKGYTVTRTYHVNDNTTAIHTYWTQRGRFFLYDFLKEHGIIPEAEKVQNLMIGGSVHIDK